jgi:hypothetical protein
MLLNYIRKTIGALILTFCSHSIAIGFLIKDKNGRDLGFLVPSTHQPLVVYNDLYNHLENIAKSTTFAYFELLGQDHPQIDDKRASFSSHSLKLSIQASIFNGKHKCIASLADQRKFTIEASNIKSTQVFLKIINSIVDWPVQAVAGILSGPLLINDRNHTEIKSGARFISSDALMLKTFRERQTPISSLESWYEQTASDRNLSEDDALIGIDSFCNNIKAKGDQVIIPVSRIEYLYSSGEFDKIRLIFKNSFEQMNQAQAWESKFLQREKIMAERIDEILRTSIIDSVLSFIIGAAHIGGNGVILRLESLGYKLIPMTPIR